MNSFAALADPTRRRIVERLAGGECSFGELAENFEISRPAVSQHLKVLKDARIVSSRAAAQQRIYRLNETAFDELREWVASLQNFWNASLDRLEEELQNPRQASNTDTRSSDPKQVGKGANRCK